MSDGRYIALFSGGKDSYLALEMAQENGYTIDRLVTVEADQGSYLYHTPTTQLTTDIAASLSLPLERIEVSTQSDQSAGSEGAADREIEPLVNWLDDTLESEARPPAGLISGVVESQYQYDRLSDVCTARDLELVTPLWQLDGHAVLDAVLDRQLEVDIVAVAADGLDRSWLGRRLDREAIAALKELAEEYGIHPAGEGGEFETLVVDAPAFDFPIRYDAEVVWEGNRGHLVLTDSTDSRAQSVQ